MFEDSVYILYIIAKFLGYSLWCFVGIKLWSSTHAKHIILSSLKYGFLRLLLGVLFGAMIFITYQTNNENLGMKYIMIYFPIRIIEWWLIYKLIIRTYPAPKKNIQIWLWILGGILVSFAIDLLSPEGVKGHFCVGRCLC